MAAEAFPWLECTACTACTLLRALARAHIHGTHGVVRWRGGTIASARVAALPWFLVVTVVVVTEYKRPLLEGSYWNVPEGSLATEGSYR